MSRRTAIALAALVLTPGCTKQQQIATATPADELPQLIVPAELRVDAGAMAVL